MPWSLQDAKNRFSQVVDAAVGGEPQVVTRHGKPTVVVVAASEYERLARIDRSAAPSFGEWLLAIPQDDGSFERATLEPRDVDPACS
ncbi:MAG: type II toxin-antitoxin system Phd/YefM family antitoxin [Rhodospirillales bacterium]|nr:type II toxin-antitoxin system Phd/YefM family antitoxin [Rhodospirillales bacterium]